MASVLIAGAGPIGLTMANELARYGVAVRIVDKAAARTDKSKALVLWPRTLELLLHGGYVEPFLKAGNVAHGAQLSDGKTIVARVTMDGIDTVYPYALMIAQSETERVLEETLASRGIKVERNVSMESFSEKSTGGLEAVLRTADGKSETVQADWLLGCDGAHSTTRHALGFTFEGSTQDSDWYLADVHVTGLEPTDMLHIFWHRDGILAFFPISAGRWRVIADLGPATGSGHHPDPTLDEIQAMVAHRGNPGIKLKDPVWLAAFRINERKVKDYGRGRVFLAGDAAHIHSPAGGQGMNTGMQDAFNLSWKLNLVIKGIAKPSLLDSYSTERSAVGEMVLSNAGRMTEAAIARNPVIQSLRNAMVKFALSFPQIGHVMADTLSELNIAYPKSPLSVAGAHPAHGPKPGHRWPEPIAADTGKSRFMAIGPADAVADLVAKFPNLVAAASGAKRADARDLTLVRPDGYVGFAGAASDRAGAEAYLRGIAA
jgi:2-polyprenyl-6-methoxyphenol hydroxylase-like FAD-dependent oxidoreductase